MIIKTIEKLLNSDLSAYYISKKTGVSASSIQRLRSGDRQLNKLTLDSAEKLYLFELELEQNQLNNGGVNNEH
ncbi:TPA: XRE family transcriptional regulator [Staphylococcus aureus]|uniref:XRE family transcriptional regulator n=1 Tax=Staphylococcus epidermidis TaxID=1282 RepID=UPI0011A397D3|nr:XRE family transcriptional regulator [Staphylococcus epidermidis]MCG2076172.1 XRE family transcriptional regulator [Staphylococcus epidermidis]HDG9757393.1 XRE family transcriptional regulator [Staphylococcus aureus]